MATLVKISWSVGGSKPREKIYEPHPVLGSPLGTEEGEKLLYKSLGQLRKSNLPQEGLWGTLCGYLLHNTWV